MTWSQQILTAMHEHHWQAAVALCLIGFVAAARAVLPRIHLKAFSWINTDRGAASFTLASALLGAIGTALLAGKAISGQLLWAGITTGFMAAGGWATLRRILPANWWDILDALLTPVAKTGAKVLPLVAICLALSGCACWQADHASSPGCKILRSLVDCTKASVLEAVPNAMPLVIHLISTGTTDWAAITARLEAAGFSDGMCILATIEKNLSEGTALASFNGNPFDQLILQASLAEWRAKHPKVTFELLGSGGQHVLR